MDRSRILNIYLLSLHCGLTISTYYHNPKALFIREAFKKQKKSVDFFHTGGGSWPNPHFSFFLRLPL